MARVRSPNYPALSLPAALDRVRTIQGHEGRNAVAREVIVKHLGFGGMNGASATVLSALTKYGLLDNVGDGEAKVSELAMTILFPHSPEEKRAALQKAAFSPVLFTKIHEKWPDRTPSDESLRSYLIREGFSAGGADQVIQFYRETLEIATPREAVHDSPPVETKEAKTAMVGQSGTVMQQTAPPPASVGKPFTIGFDGTMLTGTIAIQNVRDIDRLIRVLGAQKAAFVAMMGDDEDGEDEDGHSPTAPKTDIFE